MGENFIFIDNIVVSLENLILKNQKLEIVNKLSSSQNVKSMHKNHVTSQHNGSISDSRPRSRINHISVSCLTTLITTSRPMLKKKTVILKALVLNSSESVSEFSVLKVSCH